MCEFKSPMTNYTILNFELTQCLWKYMNLRIKIKTRRKPVRRAELLHSHWTDFPRDETIYPALSWKNIQNKAFFIKNKFKRRWGFSFQQRTNVKKKSVAARLPYVRKYHQYLLYKAFKEEPGLKSFFSCELKFKRCD